MYVVGKACFDTRGCISYQVTPIIIMWLKLTYERSPVDDESCRGVLLGFSSDVRSAGHGVFLYFVAKAEDRNVKY